MNGELTVEERRAIASLKRLEKTWPKSLWIFAGAGATVSVMRKGPDGKHALTKNGGTDPAFIVATIRIENDGGDW